MTGISESVLFQMNVLKYIDNELFKKKITFKLPNVVRIKMRFKHVNFN